MPKLASAAATVTAAKSARSWSIRGSGPEGAIHASAQPITPRIAAAGHSPASSGTPGARAPRKTAKRAASVYVAAVDDGVACRLGHGGMVHGEQRYGRHGADRRHSQDPCPVAVAERDRRRPGADPHQQERVGVVRLRGRQGGELGVRRGPSTRLRVTRLRATRLRAIRLRDEAPERGHAPDDRQGTEPVSRTSLP